MPPLLRDFLIGFALGAVILVGFAVFREGTVFEGAALVWQIPLGGLFGGLLFVVRRSSSRGAQRLGQRLAGRDPDRAEAESDRAWRSFRSRRPVLSVLVIVAIVAVGAGLVWLRVAT